MKEAKTKRPLELCRALVDSKTFNEENRTVEVTFGTDKPILMRGWDGSFYEQLSFDPAHVRMDRLNSGAPVLNSHNRYDLDSQLGVVERAWIQDKKEGRALVKFSEREEFKGIIADIKGGVIRNISVGYRVYKYEETVAGQDGVPNYRAIDWEPNEVSFVTVPADYGATVRAEGPNDNDVIILKRDLNIMEEIVKPKGTEERTEGPAPVDAAKIAETATRAERERAAGIKKAVKASKLGDDFAQRLIDDGTTVEKARELIIDEFAKADPAAQVRGTVTTGGRDEHRTMLDGIERAMLIRLKPEEFGRAAAGATEQEKAAIETSRQYMGYSMLEMARHLMEARGEDTKGISKNELARRALATGDYPILLSNVANKFLMRAYSLAPQTWRPLASRMDANDFKELTGVRVGGKVNLEKVVEGGEYKHASMEEGKESFKLASYGKIVAITRQALINDDLGGFTRMSELFGRAAADLESDIMWGLITSNVKMGDNVAMFHTSSHGNLAGSGAIISETTISAARLAIRKQTGLKGEKLNLQPVYMLVPPELETAAEKFLNTLYVPGTQSDANIFAGKLKPIVEHRLSDNSATAWYIATDVNQVEMLKFGYLNGEGLRTETRNGFEVDGVEIKVALDFGAAAWDYRGFYKNPGA